MCVVLNPMAGSAERKAWKEMLTKWKNAKSGLHFYSNLFGISNNWIVFVIPNGDGLDHVNGIKKDFVLGLRLLQKPFSVGNESNDRMSVKCMYKVMLIVDDEEIEFEEEALFNYADYSWFAKKYLYA